MAKAVRKHIKGVGTRCVIVKANGQWKFAKNTTCGLGKKKGKRGKRSR